MSTNSPRIETYCFDIDDTLTATSSHCVSVLYPELARHFELAPPTQVLVRETWGGPLDEALMRLFPNRNVVALKAKLKELHATHPAPLLPGAERILKILSHHGRHTILFSAGDRAILDIQLSTSLASLPYSRFVSLQELGVRKEHPGALQAVLAAGCASPSGSVLVAGDDPRDGLMARNGGAAFRGVLTGVFASDDFVQAEVSHQDTYASLEDALAAPTCHGVVVLIRRNNKLLFIKEGRTYNPHFGKWSGPHGRCQASDILEEESVRREVFEEVGADVRAGWKICTQPADTKVSTVSFWTAFLTESSPEPFRASQTEVSEVAWLEIDRIRAGEYPLYPGTEHFFREATNITEMTKDGT